jgi:hypothetical protein
VYEIYTHSQGVLTFKISILLITFNPEMLLNLNQHSGNPTENYLYLA